MYEVFPIEDVLYMKNVIATNDKKVVSTILTHFNGKYSRKQIENKVSNLRKQANKTYEVAAPVVAQIPAQPNEYEFLENLIKKAKAYDAIKALLIC